MKKLLLIIPLILISCKTEITEVKYKLFYIDGKTEIITVNRIGGNERSFTLKNGCFYRTNGMIQIRCGISYNKILSVRQYEKHRN